MADLHLTPEQEAGPNVWRPSSAKRPRKKPGGWLASRRPSADARLLGAAEFEIRDRAHALAAHALKAAVNGRKNGAAKGRV